MKNKYSIYSFLMILVVLSVVSCKEDEVYAPKILSDAQMQFQVADGVLTGSAFVGLVQPSSYLNAARFSKATAGPNLAGGNVVVSVIVDPNVTGVVVNVLGANGIQREQRASLTGSGTLTFTYPIATLGLGGTNPANNALITLEFVGTTSDGKKSSRFFYATIIA